MVKVDTKPTTKSVSVTPNATPNDTQGARRGYLTQSGNADRNTAVVAVIAALIAVISWFLEQ